MLELIRHQGMVTYTKFADRASLGPLPEYEWNVATQAHLFVFNGKPFEETIKASSLLEQKLAGPLAMPDIDAPFPIFTIELAGDKPLAYSKVDKVEYNFENLSLTPKPVPGEYITVETYCLLVQELEPTQYGFWSMHRQHDPFTGTEYWQVAKTNNDGEIVKHYLDRLARERTGLERVNRKFKIGTGKGKRFHRISEVIHVRPKAEAVNTPGTREVDWSHRFEVRGHWRKTDGIGKDRAGMYCVKGFTWVTEHVRGPDHLPLIKKTRLVD